MRVLSVGPLWRGSNAGGLFRALSRAGCLVEILDEFYYLSLKSTDKFTKIAERLLRPRQEQEFNKAIKSTVDVFKPDVLLVYKGVFVQPETLSYARQKGCRLALFYPDVSMTAHGVNIPRCIPMYDVVFTTKTFGITDMQAKYGVKNAHFIPHGFDPDIHRPLPIGDEERKIFGCDASFIGTWSAKKEALLSALKNAMPGLQLKIWGDQWWRATTETIKSSIQGRPVVGDLYALAIQCSAVNLGILSEQVVGSSSGDLITSRTFHIPAASGFMLHERNIESVQYFAEGKEAAFFDGAEELIAQTRKYLDSPEERDRVRSAGHARAIKDHSLDNRAQQILGVLKQN
jgi:spore maturation protein CgeB